LGLDSNAVKFLVHSRSAGVSFERTAMIGRQSLHLSEADLRSSLAPHSKSIDDTTVARLLGGHGGYAEGLLQHFGAEAIDSFDYSAYEGASQIHDMNEPIGDRFRSRYTVVIDSGSLEHVFNFPTAIKNCMDMVAVGGHYIAVTPANNCFGHGFYQFSAETFFTIFSEPNGFETPMVLLWEELGSRWYAVSDPRTVGTRVELVNFRPAYLGVLARKIADRPVFTATPQQSDYVETWKKSKHAAISRAPRAGRMPDWATHAVPPELRHAIRRRLMKLLGVRTPDDFPEFFRPMKPPR